MPASKIHVLHVITRLVVGGAQENTLLTAARLDPARYEVTLASGPTTGPEGSLEDRVSSLRAFERIPELVRSPHPMLDPAALGRLYALMRRHRYHIVHTHTTKAGILGRIAARLARIPIILHTPHGHAFHDYLNQAGSEVLRRLERWLAGHTDQIICLTEAERDEHLRLGIGPPERFAIIHSGVDIERFRSARPDVEAKRRELHLPPIGPLVGCVARLATVKGVQHLLDAVPRICAAVPNATVVCVGDGPLRPELERHARVLGVERSVVFPGVRRDVDEIMPLFDVVVLPSLNEGMGKAAIEAMAAGRLVIGSRVSGLQDVIVDGQTGFLVPPAEPEELAATVIRCLTDMPLTRAMGIRGQRLVDRYSIEVMIEKIERLYARWLTAKEIQ
ncbi:MAG TPA: glycosyltransferase family 4 protein [bacterium]|nr:glycosyltransferase family 4 protein [bacterium]